MNPVTYLCVISRVALHEYHFIITVIIIIIVIIIFIIRDENKTRTLIRVNELRKLIN